MNPANSRIIKNTGMLFMRLVILTFVNLYAVRVTLEALGQTDFGLYNVIASVVTSLTVLSGAMTSATQRFLSFHLGRKDYPRYSHTFTLMLMCFIAIAIALVLIGEILGYFFIYKWLTIPTDRLTASFWVYQASLAAFAIGFVTIPYNSSIIANEKMNAFAAFSVVEGLMKLGIAFLIIDYAGDRLIFYGWLTMLISIVVLLMSMGYCHSKIQYCQYIWKWDGSVFRELSKYTGWNLFGSISGLLTSQGQNILINIFFGPIVNAAKAIADRIRHVINGFSVNLYMAVSPQIIKSYATKDYTRALNLVLKTSKMSFLLTFIMAFPLICNIENILRIWLGDDSITPDMSFFSQLLLIYCMVLSLEPPLTRIIQATGDIRNYEVTVGVITLSYIPITALILYFYRNALMVLIMLIAVMAIAQCIRIMIAHRQVGLAYNRYLRDVVRPISQVSITGTAVYLLTKEYLQTSGLILSFLQIAATTIIGLLLTVLLGLDAVDRTMIFELLKKKIRPTT